MTFVLLLIGTAVGMFALLTESKKIPGRLRLKGWWRAGLVALVTVFLDLSSHPGHMAEVWWVFGIGAGVGLRYWGHSGGLDRWNHLPGIRVLTARASATSTATGRDSEGAAADRELEHPAGSLMRGGTVALKESPVVASTMSPVAPTPPSAVDQVDLGRGAGVGDHGGMPARRAMVRWAWRLFRREWRQQLLVLILITVAVATTILGAGIGTNTPPPADAGFGTANHLVAVPGSDPHLSADIAAMAARFGPVDVIENKHIATGVAGGAQLRTQNPTGPFGSPMLALVSGHYPKGAGEVGMTPQLASTLSLHVGGLWHEGNASRRLVGLVENPQSLLDNFALVARGQLSAPSQVTVLFDATTSSVAAFTFPPGTTPVTPQPSGGISPAVIVLIFAIFGLIFIGLVAVAGFTVLAQRRMRSLGMLSSLGATDRHVRLVMVTNGVAVGICGALVGTVIGLAAWVAYAPRLASSAHHRVGWSNLPWWLVATALVLAILTATLASRRPARAIARVPIVAALSGRPVTPRPVHRSAGPALALLIIGPVLIGLSGNSGVITSEPEFLAGIVAAAVGLLLLAPIAIAALAFRARRAPIANRIALRDLSRYRSRSGAALAATSFAVLIAMIISLGAAGRYSQPLDYFGPNLPSGQLAIYPPGDGPDNGGSNPAAPAGPALAAEQRRATAIATSLGSHDVLPLEATADLALFQVVPLQKTRGTSGPLYVATPTLLRHYGINPHSIDPTATFITSRPGLAGAPGLRLSDFRAGAAFAQPLVQAVNQLPTDTADPNLLVTMYAVQHLKLQVNPAGWLIQTPQPLTALQVNVARQSAAAAGMTIETKNEDPSLTELRNYATIAGILLALGVLAMTVGLIRGESAAELRTLTAVGATRRVRRTIVATTAGVLSLLGAVLGTAAAYLVIGAFFWSDLVARMGNVPVFDLLLVLVGLPVIAAGGGWLFAGREPTSINRQLLG